MENAQVTFDLGWLIAAVFIPIIGLQFKQISDVKSDLANYKLSAKDRFASVGHLQEVETRLTDAIKSLQADIRELTKAIAASNNFVSRTN